MCSSRKVAIFLTLMTIGKLVDFGGAVLGIQLPETLVFLFVPHGIFVEAQVA